MVYSFWTSTPTRAVSYVSERLLLRRAGRYLGVGGRAVGDLGDSFRFSIADATL